MARVDTSNLHKASAGVASAYEGVRNTTQSAGGAIAGGVASAINAGIEGYKTGKELEKNALEMDIGQQELENSKLKNEYQATQNEILNKSKNPMIEANIAQAQAQTAQAKHQENLANKSTTMLDYAEHQSRKNDKALNNFMLAREASAKAQITPTPSAQNASFNPSAKTLSPFSTAKQPLTQGTQTLKAREQPSVFLRQ